GRGGQRRGVASSRDTVVSGGRRHGSVAPYAFGSAAVWAVSVVHRAGADRALACSRAWSARDRPPAGAGAVDDLAGAAPQRRLPRDFPDDEAMRISHEAIYQALYVQGRGALRRELTGCLRTGRALRVPRARSRGRGKHFVTPELLISQRPAEATDRAVPGHWE